MTGPRLGEHRAEGGRGRIDDPREGSQGRSEPCSLNLEAGELRLQQPERNLVIPMDPAIRLEQLEQDQRQLKLSGCAQVSPEPLN